MKKNLKKAISAVLALALSVGSAAMAAPTFTDVAETAANAQAINTLAALGVIKGYEDGSFKPDNNITRAEVATMVVAALNRSADAEGAKGTTKFDDMNVDAKAWATGFVNIGVSEGFISGFEDGSFKPDNNVTFAQMVSMLVRVAGYGRYAEYLGGWPNGYLSVGNDKGVTKNVSAGADTAVTRGQVAQMIYNTLLNVPVVESTTLTTDRDGNLVPEMTIMDGKDGQYKTLLTEKHDAYYVEGFVSKTSRTNPTQFEADEVEFSIEYTENYNDSEIVWSKVNKKNNTNTSGDTCDEVPVFVGNTDAAANLFAYSSAIIKIDEDDEATLVSYIPSGKNTVETFNANLIDDEDYKTSNSIFADPAKPYLKYYTSKDSSKSTKYKLAGDEEDEEWKLYVNGVEVEDPKAEDVQKYIIDNTVGEVQLIDRYSAAGRADGNYDIIYVTYYGTATVGSVNTTTGKISFNERYNLDVSNIVLDPEDDEISYEIIYNGEEVELSALQVDDVISIAYDVTAVDAGESTFFEIHVSRATAEGKYTGKNDDDKAVTIGGTQYEFVQGYKDTVDGLVMADTYTLYLDAFGRIFDYETAESSAKIAIIDRFTKSSADDYYRATIYTTDGAAKSLEVDTNKVSLTNAAIGERVYGTSFGSNDLKKTPIETRVVEYKISSSSGRIISLEFIDAGKAVEDGLYKASSRSLSGIKMNDATKVIDAIDYMSESDPTYSDLSISSIAGFADDGEYTAYAFGKKATDGTYPVVIVTAAGGKYTFETNFAVVLSTPSSTYDEASGDELVTVELLYKGEELIDDEAKKFNDDWDLDSVKLAKGDVVVFVEDGNGLIKDYDVLVKASTIGTDAGYDTVLDNAFANKVKANLPDDANNWTTTWTVAEDDKDKVNHGKEVTRLVYGAVVAKTGKYFTLGSFADGEIKDDAGEVVYDGLFTDLAKEGSNGGAIEINLTDATNVYVYDFSKSSKFQLDLGTNSDITPNTLAKSQYLFDGDLIPWDATENNPKAGTTFAFAKVVDDDATDVYVILAE